MSSNASTPEAQPWEDESSSAEYSPNVITPSPAATTEPAVEPAQVAAPAPREAPKAATPARAAEQSAEDSSMGVSQRNAVGKAQSYLRHMAFSRTGLIEQLEYEGFSNADAAFAVDSLSIDYREQAVK